MEGKVAVLGDSDFVMPFTALGLDVFAVADQADDVQKAALAIVEQKYTLVVVAENIATLAEEVFSKLISKPACSIVVVPFTTESEGFAAKALGTALKTATGIDIF